MTLLEIELAGPAGRMRTIVPDDVPVGQFVAWMASLVGPETPSGGPWLLYRAAGGRIPPDASLSEAGVDHGHTLHVTQATIAIQPDLSDLPPFPVAAGNPSERTRSILPERPGRRRRVTDTVAACIGTRYSALGAHAGVWERTRDVWRWGDYTKRLEWMIGRPRLGRAVTIGVTRTSRSTASPALATALSRIFADVRSDRVTRLDEARLDAGARPGRAPAPGLERPSGTDTGFGTKRVTTPEGGLISGDAPHGTISHSFPTPMNREVGIVVLDCGPVGVSRLVDTCEQVVLVSDGVIEAHVRRSLARRPTVVALTPGSTADLADVDDSLPTAMGVIRLNDGTGVLETAALLAAGWPHLGGVPSKTESPESPGSRR